jgi:hypothetical protein
MVHVITGRKKFVSLTFSRVTLGVNPVAQVANYKKKHFKQKRWGFGDAQQL